MKERNSNRFTSIVLWGLQLFFCIVFIVHGISLMILLPQLIEMIGELGNNLVLVRFVGIVELLGGIGLIVTWVTKIMPRLTPIAAIGLTVLMLGTVIAHVQVGEISEAITNFVVAICLVVLAIGRLKAEVK